MMIRSKWTERLKQPIIPGHGWDKIVSKFTLKDGEVLLIQYNQGDEPPVELVDKLNEQIRQMNVNATVLLLPAEMRAEHVPLHRVGDLLDTIIELADNALKSDRINKKYKEKQGEMSCQG
jgi:hypothetical protein